MVLLDGLTHPAERGSASTGFEQLIAVGVAVSIWYLVWGTRSCNDEGGNTLCAEMYRHRTMFFVAFGSLCIGVLLALDCDSAPDVVSPAEPVAKLAPDRR